MAYEYQPPEFDSDPGAVPPKKKKLKAIGLPVPSIEAGSQTKAEAAAGAGSLLKDLLGQREVPPPVKSSKKEEGPAKQPEAPVAAEAQELSPARVAELSQLSPEEASEVATQLVSGRRELAINEGAPDEVVEFYNATDEGIQADQNLEEAAAGAVASVTGEVADAITLEELATAANPEQPLDQAEPDDDRVFGAAYVPPSGGAGFGGGGPPGGPNFGYGNSFNTANTVPMATAPEEPEVVIVERQRGNPALAALVGGVIGYLIGRLRGQKLTERQMRPVQEALAKKVRNQDALLGLREAQVRRFAAEKEAAEARATAAEMAPPPKPEVKPAQLTPFVAEQVATGHVEGARATTHAEQLHHEDLLKISETIVVGATTIRRVFETDLISERGLRRIVSEHLRGGDVRRVLTEELMIKEIGHELDPMLRDRSPEDTQTASGASSAASTGSNVQQSSQSTISPAGSHTPAISDIPDQSRPVPAGLIIANITALAILAGLALILLILWIVRH